MHLFPIIFKLSVFLWKEGKYPEALGKWEAALNLIPENAKLQEQKAQVLLEIGDAWKALKAATRRFCFYFLFLFYFCMKLPDVFLSLSFMLSPSFDRIASACPCPWNSLFSAADYLLGFHDSFTGCFLQFDFKSTLYFTGATELEPSWAEVLNPLPFYT